ncbi:hypothetical protein K7X08_029740 [Anisodus acutangulus]|uniref:Protein kinase domain-containing protein n=1 Tax=Anisodus acutangulus TaxID=402998 RepID=A0A9Q1L3J5_9SOLA|nr:hypothetical protein K7X08_029740 [Anisodus acutangulus]
MDKERWRSFALSELQAATNSFHQENLIGKGGYAEVYKGCLRSGQFVAIKRLTKGPQDERTGDFLSELGIMAHVNHPNISKLIGYAVEGGFFVVLQLSPNGSLANMLQMSKQKLDWKIRYKSGNNLLQKCEICEFDLAKWLPERWTHLTVSKLKAHLATLHRSS